MIKLQQLKKNPFEKYPYLLKIWPTISSKIMRKATKDFLKEGDKNLFLIKKNTKVIGLSGYYLTDKETHVGLRWHGIVKEERSKGYSEEAITQVLLEVKKECPKAKYIMEYVLLTDYSDSIITHFKSLGFKKFGAIQDVDWTPNRLQGYKVNIDKYLEERI